MTSRKSAERLVSAIIESYQDTSPLRSEFDCRVFDKQPSSEYTVLSNKMQGTSNLLAPDIEFFGNFPQSIANNIGVWERNHILNNIRDRDSLSISVDAVTEEELFDVLTIVDNPTKVYLPFEKEYMKEYMMDKSGILSENIDVEWLNSDIDDFEKGFVVDSNRIQISQYSQMPPSYAIEIDDIMSEYSDISDDASIFVEFSRPDDPSEIELYFGTVLDENPYFGPRSIGTIEMP